MRGKLNSITFKPGLVSVIMPSFNTASYIGEAIQSVINQTYKELELLIVDDCSTDNTDGVVASFSDSRIRYFKNLKNSGAAVSRNRALREAKGEWIAFLDSDDLWMPEKLERQIHFMRNNQYYFTCTGRNTIDEDSKAVGEYSKSPKHVGKLGMKLYCWPGSSSVMYHAPTVGLIQITDLKKNNDYAMWLKVIHETDFYYMDECLESYRIREGSISHDSLKNLIKSHYLLWHIGEKKPVLTSCLLTGINMVCGVVKKMVYVKRDNKRN